MFEIFWKLISFIIQDDRHCIHHHIQYEIGLLKLEIGLIGLGVGLIGLRIGLRERSGRASDRSY